VFAPLVKHVVIRNFGVQVPPRIGVSYVQFEPRSKSGFSGSFHSFSFFTGLESYGLPILAVDGKAYDAMRAVVHFVLKQAPSGFWGTHVSSVNVLPQFIMAISTCPLCYIYAGAVIPFENIFE
jgi:hypothetical protein